MKRYFNIPEEPRGSDTARISRDFRAQRRYDRHGKRVLETASGRMGAGKCRTKPFEQVCELASGLWLAVFFDPALRVQTRSTREKLGPPERPECPVEPAGLLFVVFLIRFVGLVEDVVERLLGRETDG